MMEEIPMISPDPVDIINMVNMINTMKAPPRPIACCATKGVTSPGDSQHNSQQTINRIGIYIWTNSEHDSQQTINRIRIYI